VHTLKQRDPENRFLRRRLIWAWTAHACIVLATGATMFTGCVEFRQILADLILAERMVRDNIAQTWLTCRRSSL
jgi:hypothetical protein